MSCSFSTCRNGFKKISHVIFDLDGLLLDTETIYNQAIINILKRYGKEYTTNIKRQILGSTAYELAVLIVNSLEIPLTPEEFLEAKLIEQEKLGGLCNAQLMPVIAGIAKKYGKTFTIEVKKKLLGTLTEDTCKIAVSEMELPISPEEFQYVYTGNSHEQFGRVTIMPGAEKFVTHLYEHKIPMAVATSSSQIGFDLKTFHHQEFFSKFHHKVISGSDPEVKKGKPHPDVFLICAQRFPDNPHPSECLAFEDAPNGIIAASKAGMQTVMIPDEEIMSPELKKLATLVLKSMTEFKPEVFGLPPYKY